MTDLTMRELLTRAADRLDALTAEATPAPWNVTQKSAAYGGLVCIESPAATSAELEGYDGELVGESMSPANRALVAALRLVAEPLAAWLRDEAADWDENEPAAAPGTSPSGRVARAVLGAQP